MCHLFRLPLLVVLIVKQHILGFERNHILMSLINTYPFESSETPRGVRDSFCLKPEHLKMFFSWASHGDL